jgi:hypothetical protein
MNDIGKVVPLVSQVSIEITDMPAESTATYHDNGRITSLMIVKDRPGASYDDKAW